MNNVYKPDLMEVLEVHQHTPDVKSVKIKFQDPALAESFAFRVGQFGMFSVFGAGESTFNICSSSNWKGFLEFCFRKTGKVTESLWQTGEGDTIDSATLWQQLSDGRVGRQNLIHRRRHCDAAIRCAVWYARKPRQVHNITVLCSARCKDLVSR